MSAPDLPEPHVEPAGPVEFVLTWVAVVLFSLDAYVALVRMYLWAAR